MTSTDDTYCRHAYADDPTLRAVQINRMGRPATPDHDFCRALETTYQFETALAEWPLGVCGFIFDRHHQGEKISGYTGWQIRFILDRFGVTVATKEEYPANKAWMESTAAQIEANIRSQMRPVAD